MPSNHLILCRPLLFPPSIFPSIRVFSNESALRIRWPKDWSFSFSISPSNMCTSLSSFASVMTHWKFDCTKNTDKFRNLCCKVGLFPSVSKRVVLKSPTINVNLSKKKKNVPKHSAYYHQPPQDIHFYHQSNYFMLFQVNPLATTLNFNYYLLMFLILNFIKMESYRMFTFVSGFFI